MALPAGTLPEDSADIIVVGAGFAGLVLARALAGAGLRVAVVDRRDPGRADPGGDGRVFAISAGSRRVLDALGLWAALAPGAQPIARIEVGERSGPALVHFDHAEMAAGPLGHVVESGALHAALLAAARATAGITLIAPAAVADIAVTAAAAHVALEDGRALRAALVVGADGRDSVVRARARINATQWSYDQAALVTTIAHARPHGDTAEERFLAGGPFAALPMLDGADGGHRSSLVWTEPTARAADLAALGAADFDAEMRKRLGDRLGDARAIGPRWSYPLVLSLAESYVAERLALIGDAAHVLHPIAGQGLNLGIRDAAALAEVVVDAHRLGLDIGMTAALRDYERWRRFDNTALAAATDLLNRLFAPGFAPLRAARALGMAALNRIGPARRAFMAEAMGLAGEAPRLLRGEKL